MAILMIAGALATKGNEIEVWELFRGRLVNKLSRLVFLSQVLFHLSEHNPEKSPCFNTGQQKDSSSKEKERQLHKLLKAIYDLNELPNRKLIQVYPDGKLE
ncbi:hypothetical protein KY290_007123 [Solanum tuberosum]|uniref:Uncharacterized protein n=1 Tax=Solanum tuberosum TaxID=4113 RepID=A0ABQ7W7A3_SOLTU|nr:hypothetical protein KY290_007123 [Solanum tuberosum]